MSRKGKETSKEAREIVIRHQNLNKSLREISEPIGRPRSTIQSVIKKFNETNTVGDLRRSGRPSSLTDQDKRVIVYCVERNPHLSVLKINNDLEQRGVLICDQTVRNVLHENNYHGRNPRKKFWHNLPANAEKLGLMNAYTFQYDNDPKHSAINTELWILYNCPKQLSTPPQSPDIDPIEHLWSYPSTKIRTRHISNKRDLKAALNEEWEMIPSSLIRKLVESLPRRLEAVIRAKGYRTKY